MSDYEITIRARNARILRLIRAQGFDTVRAFCNAHKLSYNAVIGLVVSRTPAITADDWTPTAKRLAAALGAQPDALFTSRQAEGRIKAVTREASESELIALSEARTDAALLENDPEEKAQIAERNAALTKELAILTPRARDVLERRFGIGHSEQTYGEISEIFGISKERIRQIEMKALRQLRSHAELHKSHLRPFRDCN
jgi:RNA polymerase sigma factor (sigma-70 family)